MAPCLTTGTAVLMSKRRWKVVPTSKETPQASEDACVLVCFLFSVWYIKAVACFSQLHVEQRNHMRSGVNPCFSFLI